VTIPASDSVRQSARPFIVLVNIKLLLFDAAAPTAMAAALARKMAQGRLDRKCRMSLVSIASGYGVRIPDSSATSANRASVCERRGTAAGLSAKLNCRGASRESGA
jgi:hypothetical protein